MQLDGGIKCKEHERKRRNKQVDNKLKRQRKDHNGDSKKKQTNKQVPSTFFKKLLVFRK